MEATKATKRPFPTGRTVIRHLMNSRPELSGDDPIRLFDEWLQAAEEKELNDPTAAALATATRAGVPSVRMVLIKGVEAAGFSLC